jgi:peptide/nickel transport system substrate-binding protein
MDARRLTRRSFIRTAAGIGVSGPAVVALLQACAPASPPSSPTAIPTAPAKTGPTVAPTSAPPAAAKPAATTAPTAAAAPAPAAQARRGGGGTFKILSTLNSDSVFANLNPHHNFPGDADAARLIHEPLLSIDPDINFIPMLAAEVPNTANGTIDPNGKWVTYTLKKDVAWHDGRPFTADDVIFTWEFTADAASGTVTRGNYSNIASIDKLDDLRVRVNFKDPTPLWWLPFSGDQGMIIPKHLLAAHQGAGAKTAPYNQNPVGTGPYKFAQLRPGDVVIVELNDKYHVPNRPFFDRIEYKNGGGDGALAARSVMQTGEQDFAFNLHLSVDKVLLQGLDRPEAVGKIVVFGGTSSEHIQLNPTDPNTEVDGERSNVKSKHPFFSDPQVRQAVAVAIDRQALAAELGPIGSTPAVYMAFQNPRYFPAGDEKETRWEYNPAKANQLLDGAGWLKGSDGVRAKDGKRMSVLYTAAASPARQATQAVVKKQLEAIGFEVELKAVPSNVFTSRDPSQGDSFIHFRADIQQYSGSLGSADPIVFFARWTTSGIPQKANNYAGFNMARFSDPEYDRLVADVATEMNTEKRVATYRRLNEIMATTNVLVPLWHNSGVAAINKKVEGFAFAHTWECLTWNIDRWTRA